MFLEQAAWTLASAVIGGLIVGIVVTIVQNHPRIIRAKIKAEAIQKLKLDSMINVINGTDEFQKGINELTIIMVRSAEDLVDSIHAKGNVSAGRVRGLILEKQKEFMIKSHEPASAINKFIFSLKRDIIINGKDEKVEEEREKIENIYNKMRAFILGIEVKKIATDNEKLSRYTWEHGSEINAINESGKSVEIIWKIYKEKLDKEQEDLFSKFFKFVFRKRVNE